MNTTYVSDLQESTMWAQITSNYKRLTLREFMVVANIQKQSVSYDKKLGNFCVTCYMVDSCHSDTYLHTCVWNLSISDSLLINRQKLTAGP